MSSGGKTRRDGFYAWGWAALASGCGGLLLALGGAGCRRPSHEVTVTTEASRPVAISAGALVISSVPLPAPDREVEAAGDRIAEAAIHLRHRRGDRALRALAQARAVARRALDERTRRGLANEQLGALLLELERARLVIERGDFADAARALDRLDRRLDQSVSEAAPGAVPEGSPFSLTPKRSAIR